MSTRPRESWLDDGNDDHFAEAMLLCRDASGGCSARGTCSYDGDCFRPTVNGFRKAEKALLHLLSAEDDRNVSTWFASALEHIRRERAAEVEDRRYQRA